MHGGGCPVPWPPHTCGGNIEIAATGQHCPCLKLVICYPSMAETFLLASCLTGCGGPIGGLVTSTEFPSKVQLT